MRISTGIIMSVSALVLANCATPNSNPIYQQTTKYQSSVPTTHMTAQNVNYETQNPATVTYANHTVPAYRTNTEHSQNQLARSTHAQQECVSNGTLRDGTYDCVPVSIAVNASQGMAVVTPAYQAPQTMVQNVSTTQNYVSGVRSPATPQIVENINNIGEDGTPGYYAVNNIHNDTASEVVSMAAERTDQSPVHIIDSSQHISRQTPVTTQIPVAQTSMNIHQHVIIPGDTVYSLARKSCVSVGVLKAANNINNDFYIRVGDKISLPASKCSD
ncbi:MAG: hypothetical protein COA43_09230 [Robiginitomaculum sp.]|nr:MAG: hypothetical protein COA43_09230 [Robiginitomaculum sp.]